MSQASFKAERGRLIFIYKQQWMCIVILLRSHATFFALVDKRFLTKEKSVHTLLETRIELNRESNTHVAALTLGAGIVSFL